MATKKKTTAKKSIAKSKQSPPVKISKELSKKVSDFILLKSNITAATKQLNDMKSKAHKLETELMEILQKSNQIGVAVATGSIKISEKDVFNPKDWKKIYAHILKTKKFDLLQKRLSTALLQEMYNDTGKTIAGVEHFSHKVLSVSKARK